MLDATIVNRPAYISKALRNRKKVSGAKKAGIAFENKVHRHYEELYGDKYQHGFWFQFHADGEPRPRTVQPDALHIDLDTGVVNIFEIKLAHTTNAWWQLRQLYEPIVRKYFGSHWKYQVVEVFQHNRMDQPVPEKVMHVGSPLQPSSYYKIHKVQGIKV